MPRKWFSAAGMGGLILLALSWGILASGQVSAAAAPPSFAGLVQKASPAVVNISTVKTVRGVDRLFPFGDPSDPDDPFRDFFERFFGDQFPRDFKQKSLGSGFIIDETGYILTNNHVVEKTDSITVRLGDDSEIPAQIVGRDPKTDLALIRIETDRRLEAIPLGDSDALRVGDWVVAIGNPFGLGNTVTAGIVSAKYRDIGAGSYDNFIQTDASINPGNSGGPLLDSDGKAVGINTAIFSQTGGSVGIGFAIPINMARDLLPQLKAGRVVRGWLGVMIQEITPELRAKLDLGKGEGALVADVTAEGPAAQAGIERGDVIVRFDTVPIKEMKTLPYVVAGTPVGKEVPVEVMRKGRSLTLAVKIGELHDGDEEERRAPERPELGLTVDELTPQLAEKMGVNAAQGLIVTGIEPGSPAQAAGLTVGDLLLEIDQRPVANLDDFAERVRRYKPGDTILFLVKRGGATLYVTLTLGS